MTGTWHDYESFYYTDMIQTLGYKPKWSISDKDKRPINMYELLTNRRLMGCNVTAPGSMITLGEMLNKIPTAANHAFYLDYKEDGIVCLDIEPHCPEDIKQKCLAMPYIYGEYSLSGKGYHLFFKCPDCIDEYPAAAKKAAIKDKTKKKADYEIHLNHWVTFTRNMIPPATGTEPFEPLFRELASKAQECEEAEVRLEYNPDRDIPHMAQLVDFLINHNDGMDDIQTETDMSEYEFTYIMRMYRNLVRRLDTDPKLIKIDYTDSDIAWIVYKAATKKIPWRKKHDKIYSGGRPWLFYTMQRVMSKAPRDKILKELEERRNAPKQTKGKGPT